MPASASLPSKHTAAIDFVPLSDIPASDLVALMNTPEVGKLLPLLRGDFTLEQAEAFKAAKQALWDTHGFGPWAFMVGGRFAGWGGVQPEDGEADFALILHPDFWGLGRRIFERVRREAFTTLGRDSLTILLPPARTNARAVLRMGFEAEGSLILDGAEFRKYRLSR